MKKIIKLSVLLLCISTTAKLQNLDLSAIRIAQKQLSRTSNQSNKISKRNQNREHFIADKVVDPNNYYVGPGDQLHINIISSNETFDHNLIINPTGNLLIPSVGIVTCNGLTLKTLIEVIKKEIKSWNANVKINVELEVIREFRVLVIGQFSNAGYFIVTPMTRVSDLYEQIISDHNLKKKEILDLDARQLSASETFGMRSRIAVDDFYDRKLGMSDKQMLESDLLSNRNILIFRQSDTLKIDLEKFKVTGDENHNVYIRQNDIISIPYKKQFFTIQGGVQMPGKYEYNPEDNILNAINIAGGLHPNATKDSIFITRSKLKNQSESFFVNSNKTNLTRLLPDDHIMVTYFEDNDSYSIAQILGEVKFPGIYPITKGKTTVNDIIKKAGGFLPSADSSKIYINNNIIARIPDKELERILLKNEVVRSIEENAYVKARIRTQKGSIETSVNSLKQKDIILNNSDEIYIPRYFPYIEVIGAVNAPGRYLYKPINNAKDYIKLAGGVSKNASRKKFIIKSTTGQRLKLNKNESLSYGDIIFIPDKVDYNEWVAAKELVGALYQGGLLMYYLQSIIIRERDQ